ncbi:MAG: hypothetical protein Q8L88_07770 [Bacteroidota bacterium]|nr:hypothetical protein [Bacteroidota bacterium]
MERRTFVKLLGTGGVAVLLPTEIPGCNNRQLEALRPWETLPDIPQNSDIRLKFVSYAILAPNAHNKQPWIVDLRGEGIDLYIDPKRLLPQTDPQARQITISQGTFLETLVIAASHYGIEANISLFPNGIDLLEQIGKNPVAHISLSSKEQKDIQEDELFNFILKRHTNRRVYSGPPLTDAEITTLRGSYTNKDYPLHMFIDPAILSDVAGMMTEAMRIETYNRAMHGETVEMLRFNDDEIEQHRDGLSFPNLGITGMKLFFAKLFTSRNSAFDESFLQRTVDSVREGAFSSQAMGLITSRGTTRIDEISVGRYFARLFLTAAQLGLSLQPMSQIMEIASVKPHFAKSVNLQNEEPQMLFRLGRSSPTPHSARRALNDIVNQ